MHVDGLNVFVQLRGPLIGIIGHVVGGTLEYAEIDQGSLVGGTKLAFGGRQMFPS
jgi:hypothetical protein